MFSIADTSKWLPFYQPSKLPSIHTDGDDEWADGRCLSEKCASGIQIWAPLEWPNAFPSSNVDTRSMPTAVDEPCVAAAATAVECIRGTHGDFISRGSGGASAVPGAERRSRHTKRFTAPQPVRRRRDVRPTPLWRTRCCLPLGVSAGWREAAHFYNFLNQN